MYGSCATRRLVRHIPQCNARLQSQVLRQLQTSSRRFTMKDNLQDKDSLQPQSNEYSKTGSDQGAAAVEDTAFSPDKPRPEQQLEQAEHESGKDSNPLNVSPANHEISQPNDPQKDGAQGSKRETGKETSGQRSASGGGSPKKSGTAS